MDGLHTASRDAIRAARARRDGRVFYVTVKDGARSGFLLGPYDTHTQARENVARGRQLAQDASSRAVFYAFGTASLPAETTVEPVFGR